MRSFENNSIVFTDNVTEYRGLLFFGLCLFLSYLLPFHFNPFRAFFNDWLVAFGMLILVAYSLQHKKIELHLPWITFLPIGVAFAVFIQAMLGMLTEPWDAFIPILYLLLAAIAIVIGASIAASKSGAYKLCMVLAIAHVTAGLISVIIASFQFAGHEILFVPFMMLMNHDPGVPIRPYANLGQANHLALLFCISIASVWWLFDKKHLKNHIAILLVIALLCGLAITQSRIGWVILPTFALVVQLWNRKVSQAKISWKISCALLLIYATMVAVIPTIAALLNISITPTAARVLGEAESGFRSERLELFKQAWQISLANPWFGAGWFQFGPQQVVRQDLGSSIYSHHAHNIILNFAAELGWPITITVIGIFLFWFYRCCLSRPIGTEIGFATLFFIAVIVHSMVEYPLWYAIVLVPFGLLIGMVCQQKLHCLKISLLRGYAFLVVIIMMGNLLGIGMDYRRVVAGFNQLEFQAMGINFESKAMQKPSFTVFPYMYDYFKFFNVPVNSGMSAEDIAFMERVSKRFGGALVLTKLSQAYAMNGKEDDAVRTILTIRRLHRGRYDKRTYQEWRDAPLQYRNVFNRLPPPGYKN